MLGFDKSEQGWLVRAEGRTRSECPSCRTQLTARHSRYWRQLQDLPVLGKWVALQLRLSRWRCRNREREQAIFRERLGEVVAPWCQFSIIVRIARPLAPSSSASCKIDPRTPRTVGNAAPEFWAAQYGKLKVRMSTAGAPRAITVSEGLPGGLLFVSPLSSPEHTRRPIYQHSFLLTTSAF